MQDAFVRLTSRFQHLRNRESFEPYLRRTIVNLFLSHLRKRRLERAYLEREGRSGELSQAVSDLGLRDELWRALLLPRATAGCTGASVLRGSVRRAGR